MYPEGKFEEIIVQWYIEMHYVNVNYGVSTYSLGAHCARYFFYLIRMNSFSNFAKICRPKFAEFWVFLSVVVEARPGNTSFEIKIKKSFSLDWMSLNSNCLFIYLFILLNRVIVLERAVLSCWHNTIVHVR